MADQKDPYRWEQRSPLQQPDRNTDGKPGRPGNSSRTPEWLGGVKDLMDLSSTSHLADT